MLEEIVQVYFVFEGTLFVLLFIGTISNSWLLQAIYSMSWICGVGFTVTSKLKGLPIQPSTFGVTL